MILIAATCNWSQVLEQELDRHGHVMAAPVALWILSAQPQGAATGLNWTETSNIKWCSGAGDWTGYKPKASPFGNGLQGGCPAAPANWSIAQTITACEKMC
eukprot:SAG11_NODE_12054_length_724_cov_0.984000_1_plen_100_part_10